MDNRDQRTRLNTTETHESLNRGLQSDSTGSILAIMRENKLWENVGPGVNMENWIGQANYRK